MRFRRRQSWYISRDGGMRRRGSYSVGYSEALAEGKLPRAKAVKEFGEEIVSQTAACEWHHGLAGRKVDFYCREDLDNCRLAGIRT